MVFHSKWLSAGLIAVGMAAAATSGVFAAEQGLNEPFQGPFRDALTGKTIAFVPVAMNFDLTEGWWAGLKKELKPYGLKFELQQLSLSAYCRAIFQSLSYGLPTFDNCALLLPLRR